VVTAVSSIKTRRRGSSVGCSAFNSARAAATSGRSCSAARRVFFESYVMTIVECPDRAYCRLHPLLGPQPRTDLLERQIGLRGNECEQPLLMLLERRTDVTSAGLCRNATGLGPAPDPADRCRGADIEQSCRLPRALAILDNRNHAFPEIIRVSSSHRVPLQSFRRDPNLICTLVGIPCCCSDSRQAEKALGCRELDCCCHACTPSVVRS